MEGSVEGTQEEGEVCLVCCLVFLLIAFALLEATLSLIFLGMFFESEVMPGAPERNLGDLLNTTAISEHTTLHR